jgi:hypothetical protein
VLTHRELKHTAKIKPPLRGDKKTAFPFSSLSKAYPYHFDGREQCIHRASALLIGACCEKVYK